MNALAAVRHGARRRVHCAGFRLPRDTARTMITDPWFYAVAVPAVLIVGIAKGGFAGSFGMVAVPMMALVVSPVQAAAVLLPILCTMDLIALWRFRGEWVPAELKFLLPAALAGIAAGTLLFEAMSADAIRLALGAIAVAFTGHFWISRRRAGRGRLPDYPRRFGLLAGSIAGFTSFIAHAGGPPYSIYMLRRPVDRTGYAATAIVFFAVVNFVKLVPYGWLGMLSGENVATSAVLATLAPVGVLIGERLHRRMSDRLFFGLAYVFLFAAGIKLLYDGAAAIA